MPASFNAASTRPQKMLWSSTSPSPRATCSAFITVVTLRFFVVGAPLCKASIQRGGNLAEVAAQVIAELVEQGRTQVFVTGGEAQDLEGLGRQLAVLLAQFLAQRLEPLAGIDELHPAQGVPPVSDLEPPCV